MLKNDPDGKKIIGHEYNFKTNNLFAYFYIILYYVTLNDVEYIKNAKYVASISSLARIIHHIAMVNILKILLVKNME